MCEAVVALASSTAFERNKRFAVVKEVCNDASALRIAYNRSDRHFYNEIWRGFARAILCLTVTAVLGAIELLIFEVHEGVHILVRNEHDIAAVSAVASVRTAVRHEFFTVERHFAVAAVARFDKYFYVIEKHILTFRCIFLIYFRLTFFNSSSIAFADFLPAPIARITVAAPVMASPPAYSRSIFVLPFSSAIIVPLGEV